MQAVPLDEYRPLLLPAMLVLVPLPLPLLLLLGLLLGLTRASCCCRATTNASSVEWAVQGDTNCGWTDRLATVGDASRGSSPGWSCTAAATCTGLKEQKSGGLG